MPRLGAGAGGGGGGGGGVVVVVGAGAGGAVVVVVGAGGAVVVVVGAGGAVVVVVGAGTVGRSALVTPKLGLALGTPEASSPATAAVSTKSPPRVALPFRREDPASTTLRMRHGIGRRPGHLTVPRSFSFPISGQTCAFRPLAAGREPGWLSPRVGELGLPPGRFNPAIGTLRPGDSVTGSGGRAGRRGPSGGLGPEHRA